MISKIEELEQKLYDKKIMLVDRPIHDAKSLCVDAGEMKAILVDTSQIEDQKEYRTLLLHEEEHLYNANFTYTFQTSKQAIRLKETKTKNSVITKYVDCDKLKKMLLEETPLYEIAEEFCLSEYLIKEACVYYDNNGWKSFQSDD